MATLDDLRAALIDSAVACAQSAGATVGAAMAAAGIGPQPDGQEATHNLSDAGALASTGAQAMAATRDAAALGAKFPGPPPPA